MVSKAPRCKSIRKYRPFQEICKAEQKKSHIVMQVAVSRCIGFDRGEIFVAATETFTAKHPS